MMVFTYIDIIGLTSATLFALSIVSQAINTVKTKNTKGISLWMYIIFIGGITFGMAYGFLIKKYIIVGSHITSLTASLIILSIKINNIRNGIDK